MISFMIFLAFLNGTLISLNRIINGRLAQFTNAATSSLWNHLVGFVSLLIVAVVVGLEMPLDKTLNLPPYTLVGGAIGASFVTINSWVLPKIGALRSTLLVIAGQMITAVWIDALIGRLQSQWFALLGVVLMLVGIGISSLKEKK